MGGSKPSPENREFNQDVGTALKPLPNATLNDIDGVPKDRCTLILVVYWKLYGQKSLILF
jgi:hypothetical protein